MERERATRFVPPAPWPVASPLASMRTTAGETRRASSVNSALRCSRPLGTGTAAFCAETSAGAPASPAARKRRRISSPPKRCGEGWIVQRRDIIRPLAPGGPMTHRVLVALWLLAASAPGEDPAREASMVLDAQIAAWNRGDLEGFCALYSEDAVFASTTGLHRGRAEVLERYRKRYPSRAAMGTLAFDKEDVQASADAVSIVARWRLAFPDKPEASGLTLVVLRRTPDGWRLVQDASM